MKMPPEKKNTLAIDKRNDEKHACCVTNRLQTVLLQFSF